MLKKALRFVYNVDIHSLYRPLALLDTCSVNPQNKPIYYEIYMGCSDVSEFEHIYGQRVTTPSCVYDR